MSVGSIGDLRQVILVGIVVVEARGTGTGEMEGMPAMKTKKTIEDLRPLLDAAADWFGGVGCPRGEGLDGQFRFVGDEGASRFEIWLPGQRARLRSCPDGRPFTRPVKAKQIIVSCLDDAPDAWWEIALEGTWTGLDGRPRMLRLADPVLTEDDPRWVRVPVTEG